MPSRCPPGRRCVGHEPGEWDREEDPGSEDVMATDSRHEALNGETTGGTSPAARLWPVTQPHRVATPGDASPRTCAAQTGERSEGVRVVHSDPTDPDRPDARDADERQHGDDNVGREDEGNHAADERRQRPGRRARPRTATQYRASRTATAPSPYSVIPKIMPTAQELKNGPGINGTGARNRHATKPKSTPAETRPLSGARGCRSGRPRPGGRRQHDEDSGPRAARSRRRDRRPRRATARPSDTRSGRGDPGARRSRTARVRLRARVARSRPRTA